MNRTLLRREIRLRDGQTLNTAFMNLVYRRPKNSGNVLAKLYWHDYSGERINANLRRGVAFRLFNGFILASDVEKRWDDDAPFEQ